MLRATLKSLLSRKLRLLLSVLSIVVGVMFASGTQVLTTTLARANAAATRTEYTTIDVRITAKSERATIGTQALDAVRAIPGVDRADGRVRVDGAKVIGSNGKVVATAGTARYGANWVGSTHLVWLREGRGPTADAEIAVNAALVTAAGYRLGDTVAVVTPQSTRSFTLVGIVEYSGHRATLGGATEVFFITPVAQELMLGTPGTFSHLDVSAVPGVTATALRDRIAAAIGGDYEVRTSTELVADAARAADADLSFLTYLLLGFAAVSVLVGAFLIVNTFSILVAQRTRELALLRAIGASRRQITRSVLVEALVIGLLATILGLAAGIGIGALLAVTFTGTDTPVDGITVPVTAVISALVVGIGVTMVAALPPARRASRIPPIAALTEITGPGRPLTRRVAAGGILGLAGGVGVAVAAAESILPLLLAGVLLSFIGVVLLTPIVARPAVFLLGPLLRRSVPGRLGLLNTGRNPRRTANTAAALMVGLTVVTGFSVVAGSSKASLNHQFGRDAGADLFVSAEFGGSNPGRHTFDPTVLTRAAQITGVRETVGQYSDDATINGQQTGVSAATDPVAFARLFGVTTVAGTLDTRSADHAIVSASAANAFDVHVGSTVTVQLSRGAPRMVTVVGIYQTALFDGWYLSPAVVGDFATQRLDLGLVNVADGTDVSGVRRRVEQLLVDTPDIVVSDRSAFTAQLTGQIDRVLTYIQILLGLSILIAFFGIVNTLALSTIERTREIGLLRMIGLHRAQTMRMIGAEAIVLSTLGALMGLAAGTGLGTAVARALRHNGIPELAYPWARLATYLGLAVVVGVLAAILPAIRAARTDSLVAVAHE